MEAISFYYDTDGIKGFSVAWESDTSDANDLVTDIGVTPSITPTLQTETITLEDNQVFYGFSGSMNALSITSISLLVQDPACSIEEPVPEPPVEPEEPVIDRNINGGQDGVFPPIPDRDDDDKEDWWKIVLMIIGGCVGLLIIATAIIFFCAKSKRQSN